jgi:hypothetical protein
LRNCAKKIITLTSKRVPLIAVDKTEEYEHLRKSSIV